MANLIEVETVKIKGEWFCQFSEKRLPYKTDSTFNFFSPSQLISMKILLMLSPLNKLFGGENKANDHTEQVF